jgi:uncharacterized protein
MTRDQAYQLVSEMLPNKNLQRHCLAVEVIMRALAAKLKEMHPELTESHPRPDQGSKTKFQASLIQTDDMDSGLGAGMTKMIRNDNVDEFDEDEWGIVGLLHDADYEMTGKDLTRHTLVTEEKIRPLGAGERIINGVKAHSDTIKPIRENYLEKAIYAADELSGLITAVALVHPHKKLDEVKVESVLRRFKEKGFAAGAKREQILKCEDELGISLAEFVTIALKAMQGIAPELGL